MAKKTYEDIVREANEEWGEGTLIVPELGGKMVHEKVDVVSTGFTFIDDAIGVGGFPRARITEVMGQEAGGKTTLVLHVIANAQKQNLHCAFIDVEHSLDKERATKIGVDFDKLAISQPDSGEEALELLEFLVQSGQFGVIVVDSVAALTPKAELEGEMTDANIGAQARMMGKIMRKITAPTSKNNVAVIFTNQVRAKLGGFSFIPQETTPGGNALKFYASLRIDIKKIGAKKKGDRLVHTEHKLTIKKNKLAPPMRTVSFNIGENGIIDEIIRTDIV